MKFVNVFGESRCTLVSVRIGVRIIRLRYHILSLLPDSAARFHTSRRYVILCMVLLVLNIFAFQSFVSGEICLKIQ